MWEGITYPLQNFSGCIVEAWEGVINLIPHVIMDVITYPCWHFSKRGPTFLYNKPVEFWMCGLSLGNSIQIQFTSIGIPIIQMRRSWASYLYNENSIRTPPGPSIPRNQNLGSLVSSYNIGKISFILNAQTASTLHLFDLITWILRMIRYMRWWKLWIHTKSFSITSVHDNRI